MHLIVVLLTSLFLLTSSARGYILFSPSAVRQCSLKDATKPEFKICLSGAATNPDLERNKTYAVHAAMTWLRSFKMLDKAVTDTVTFTCNSPALTIVILNGNGRSYAQPAKTWIYSAVPLGVWIHELGHALVGLGDTYASGACQCKQGEPISNMCCAASGARGDHTKWSTLYNDDVTGAVINYQTMYGITEAPFREIDFDVFGPFNTLTPFKGLGEPSSFKVVDRDHLVQILQGETLTPINWKAEFE